MQVALSLGMDQRFTIETPLMWLDKAKTWKLAHELGGEPLVELIREETHTCYLGDRDTRHDWGLDAERARRASCGRPGGSGGGLTRRG